MVRLLFLMMIFLSNITVSDAIENTNSFDKQLEQIYTMLRELPRKVISSSLIFGWLDIWD
jgi:hypothetical protein